MATSISRAVHDIELSATASASPYAVFRARQHVLDRLIDEVEHEIVSHHALEWPRLRDRALRAIAEVHGRMPSRLTADVSPTSLLDHLLVAEGRLRQQYYGPGLDLEETA